MLNYGYTLSIHKERRNALYNVEDDVTFLEKPASHIEILTSPEIRTSHEKIKDTLLPSRTTFTAEPVH